MKRDWNLLRWLLDQAESNHSGYPIVLLTSGATYNGSCRNLDIGERKFEEVCEHVRLLGDSGLAEVRDLGSSQGVVIDRLTMSGHDFLNAARDETLWHKAMQIVKEKGGNIPVGVLTQVLAALVKQSLGI